jgi:beta-lactamase regulating signal transducer with metallopeptidase domain
MMLSYTFRLVVLILVTVGVIQTLVEITLRLAAPLILRVLAPVSARYRERGLYLLQLMPLLTGVLFAGFVFCPQYLRSEPISPGEGVGWACLLTAFGIILWFGYSVLRGFLLSARTIRFTAACRKACRVTVHAHRGTPIRILADPGRGIALTGFFKPFVLVSRHLIEEELSEGALEVALDHESSHAAQFDNWKLCSLYFLPRLSLNLPGGEPWMDLWRNAAEWAADDDAVHGDTTRALLLAEALVKVARLSHGRHPALASASLSEPDKSLAKRVDRLLRRRSGPNPSPVGPASFALSALALAVAGAAVVLTPWVYGFAEWVLHLG